MAITAGLESCSGQAVITMDGDLQHPPELIPQLIEQWKRGHNVVHTIRKDTERASPLKALMSRLFYWLINLASEVPIPAHAADFRLMDRTVADAFLRLREQDRFIRGLVSWIGFSQTGVEYTAGPRFAGHSKYTVRRMLRLALSAMTSFTTLPLKAAGYFGFLVAAFAFCYALYALYVRFWTGTAIPGWTSLLLAVLFLGGVQLIAIGILGAYIASIYREVKSRPLYIVQDRRGWE
jgi:dolichol-phosphate mannosyltransferase